MSLLEKAKKMLDEQDYGMYIQYMDMYEEAVRRHKIVQQRKVLSHEMENSGKLENLDYVFITYNPPEGIDMDMFKIYMMKVTNKIWVKGYLYVFEQRGEQEGDYHGIHCHMILHVKEGKSKSHIHREIANTVKKILDVSNPHLLNIKMIGKSECDRKINYLIGFKADEAKHAKQTNDIYFRIAYNLEKYYSSNIVVEQRTNAILPTEA